MRGRLPLIFVAAIVCAVAVVAATIPRPADAMLGSGGIVESSAIANVTPCPMMTAEPLAIPTLADAPPSTGLPNPHIGPLPPAPRNVTPPVVGTAPPYTGLPNSSPSIEPASTPPPLACPTPSVSGDLEALFFAQAERDIWTPTSGLEGTDGMNSCAAAVRMVIHQVTGQYVGSVAAEGFDKVANSGQFGGAYFAEDDASQAVPGDIIVWWEGTPGIEAGGADHVGFCAALACAQTLSNHSGCGCANDPSGFAGKPGVFVTASTYAGFSHFRIWHPAHIP